MIMLTDAGENWARFDESGRLCCFRSRGQEWAPAQPAVGWSVTLLVNGERRVATAVCDGEVRVETTPDSIRFTYSRLCLEDGTVLPGGATVQWRLAEGLLQGSLSVADLPDAVRIRDLTIPDLTFAWTDPRATSLIVPQDLGWVLHEAAANLFRERADFTTDAFEFQCFGWVEGEHGLYLDTRDAEGWVKQWCFSPAGERQLRIRATCVAPVHAVPASGFTLPYRISLGGFSCDWYDLGRIYRRWALERPWAARGPEQRRDSYFADIACWLWNRGHSSRVAPPSRELARRIGAPVALDWYWWHQHGYDTEYPDYFPPREGAEAFMQAVTDLQAADVRVQVYTNGVTCDMDGGSWEPVGPRATVVLEDGQFQSFAFNTFTKHRLAYACGASEEWRDVMVEVVAKARALGLDGLYLDMIGATGGYQACYSREHGHAPGGGCYGTEGFRALFQRVRAEHPGFALSTECTRENYMDLVEGYILLCTSAERWGWREKYGCPAELVPLYPSIYHGRSVCFGNYAFLDGIPPFDDLWPPEFRPDPAAEKDWHALCPDQFAFELARTVAFGCQPMVCNLTQAQLDDAALRGDVAFLVETAQFYYRHREHLLWGEMLPPGELSCETHEIRFLRRFIFTAPDQETIVEAPRPDVLHSAWTAPDGASLLVLINHRREAAEIAYRPAPGWRIAASPAAPWSCADGALRGTLPPRSLTAVPLEPALSTSADPRRSLAAEMV